MLKQTIYDMDILEKSEFEKVVEALLIKLSYKISKITNSTTNCNDYILEDKEGKTIYLMVVINAKSVDTEDLHKIIAMKFIYNTDSSWLITNRFITEDAKASIYKMGIRLTDRYAFINKIFKHFLSVDSSIVRIPNDYLNKSITIEDIDKFNGGMKFEAYLKNLFIQLGYKLGSHLQVGPASDQGKDLFVIDAENEICVQAKRWKYQVTEKAVFQAFAGKMIFNLNKAMVLTNNYFTVESIILAEKLSVELWDRDILVEKINQAKNINLELKYPEKALYLSKEKSQVFHDLGCFNGIKYFSNKKAIRFNSYSDAINSGLKMCRCIENNR